MAIGIPQVGKCENVLASRLRGVTCPCEVHRLDSVKALERISRHVQRHGRPGMRLIREEKAASDQWF
jgi:hypothetical protein